MDLPPSSAPVSSEEMIRKGGDEEGRRERKKI